MQQPKFITIDEACKILNLSKSTIYKRSRDKSLPIYRCGKKLLFDRDELQRMITDSRVLGKPSAFNQGIKIEKP